MLESLPPNIDRRRSYLILIWTLLAFAAVFVFPRMYVRTRVTKVAGWDDVGYQRSSPFLLARNVLTHYFVVLDLLCLGMRLPLTLMLAHSCLTYSSASAGHQQCLRHISRREWRADPHFLSYRFPTQQRHQMGEDVTVMFYRSPDLGQVFHMHQYSENGHDRATPHNHYYLDPYDGA